MKKRFLIFSFFVLIILYTGCSSESVTKSDIDSVPVKKVNSKYSTLKFDIPANWIELKNNEPSYFDLCLVNNAYTLAVYLIPLIINQENEFVTEQEKIKKLTSYSIALKEAEHNVVIDKNEISFFDIKDKKFASYEFKDKNQNRIDVIVFDYPNGPQEFTFSKINVKKFENDSFEMEAIKKIILNSIE